MKRASASGVGSQAVLLALSTGLAQLGIAAIFIFAARATDPATLGVVVSAMAIGATLAGLVDFGSNSFWVREIAQGVMPLPELGKLLLSKIFIGVVVASFLTAGLLVVVGTNSLLWSAGLLGLATIIGQSAQTPLRGAALGHLASAVVAFDRLIAVITYIVLSSLGTSAPLAVISALVLGPVASAILARYLIPKSNAPEYAGFRFRWPWGRSANFGVSAGFLSLQGLDVTILSAMAGSASAGVYGAVNKWIQPVSILAGAFASASAPFIARAGNFHDSLKILRQAIWIPVVAITVACSLAVLSPWLVDTLLGEAYRDASTVLTLLAIACIPGVMNQPLMIGLQYLGREKAVAVVLSAVVILQLVLVTMLAPSFGALSCALAILMVQLLQLLAFVSLAVRESRRPRSAPEVTQLSVEQA